MFCIFEVLSLLLFFSTLLGNLRTLRKLRTQIQFEHIKRQTRSFEKLMTNKGIIIKATDKGGGLALIDKSYYRNHLVNKEHLHRNIETFNNSLFY